MEIELSTYILISFVSVFSIVGFALTLNRLLPTNNKQAALLIAFALSSIIILMFQFGIKKALKIGEPIVFAEIDSTLLMRKFIYAEVKGSRSNEELEEVSTLYAKAFDHSINTLAKENRWVILPINSSVIGFGVKFDATKIAAKRIENTLLKNGYEYLPPSPPLEKKGGHDNEK